MTNFKGYFYNTFDFYREAGTFTWTKPSDIDDSKPILVHVWGAGGTGHDAYYNSNTACNGGGGGGLAVKLIDVSALGATETVTVGARSNNGTNSQSQGGSSSFGSHCSATGGNGGICETTNGGSNGGADGTANYGIGGIGSGGDVNRRGGTGGTGYYADSNNNGGGGGGSAPAPYGYRNGFNGGNGSTYAGGGGGGIGAAGEVGNYTGGSGGGTMSVPSKSQSPASYYQPAPGGNGLLGFGGAPSSTGYGYISYGGGSHNKSTQAEGDLIITPNEIGGYGGGGSGPC